MNNLSRLPRLALVAFSLIGAIATASTASAQDVTPPAETVSADESWIVPANLSQEQVRKAIIQALISRKWTIKSDADGQVVGHQSNEKREATVTFNYTATSIQVGWQAGLIDKKTGTYSRPDREASRHSWYKFIKQSVTQQLQTAAYLP